MEGYDICIKFNNLKKIVTEGAKILIKKDE